MTWILSGILLFSTFGTIMSIMMLLRYRPIKGAHTVSLRHFTLLILVYLTVILSFSILYTGLELMGLQVITESRVDELESVSHLIEDTIYFSAITMLSVGYGDLVPIGIGRFIAIVEAMFGYLLPAAFVVTSVLQVKKKV